MKQYLSYSEMRSYLDYRDSWHKTYILGEPNEPTLAMKLGTIIHESIEDPRTSWAKQMVALGVNGRKMLLVEKCMKKLITKRPVESEVSHQAETPSGIKLFCIYDGFDKNTSSLDEFKTCDKDETWTQRRVDYDDQLSFYAYAHYLTNFGYFHDIRLHRINHAKGTVHTFHTARSRRDIVYIAERIESTVASMKAEGLWEKRLSRQDILNKNQLTLKTA